MSKATPGPWVLDRSRYANSPTVIRDKNNGYIAEVYLDESPDRPAFEANASLISAAPEMLSELRNIVKQADANPFLSIGMLIEHHSGIRAAIAKAEGRNE